MSCHVHGFVQINCPFFSTIDQSRFAHSRSTRRSTEFIWELTLCHVSMWPILSENLFEHRLFLRHGAKAASDRMRPEAGRSRAIRAMSAAMRSQRLTLGIGLAILLAISAASIGMDVKSRADVAWVDR